MENTTEIVFPEKYYCDSRKEFLQMFLKGSEGLKTTTLIQGD